MASGEEMTVVVLVKASPVMTSDLEETMCVAAVRVDGGRNGPPRTRPREPGGQRDSFRQGDVEEGRRRLRELLGTDSEPALQRLVDDARNSRVAVLCVERDRNRCHRQVITDLVQETEPSIEVLQIL